VYLLSGPSRRATARAV